MNVDLGIWGTLTRRLLIFLCFVSLLMVIAMWYLPLIQRNERMRKEILRLDAEVQKQEEIAKQLKTSIDSLRFDPKAVERLSRETLGYAKPGETVIQFVAPATNFPAR